MTEKLGTVVEHMRMATAKARLKRNLQDLGRQHASGFYWSINLVSEIEAAIDRQIVTQWEEIPALFEAYMLGQREIRPAALSTDSTKCRIAKIMSALKARYPNTTEE